MSRLYQKHLIQLLYQVLLTETISLQQRSQLPNSLCMDQSKPNKIYVLYLLPICLGSTVNEKWGWCTYCTLLDYCSQPSIWNLMKQRPPTVEGYCVHLTNCIQFTNWWDGISCHWSYDFQLLIGNTLSISNGECCFHYHSLARVKVLHSTL